MSIDIATLGIKVDATDAEKASDKLDQLARSGTRASAATAGLAVTNEAGAASAAQLAVASEAAAIAETSQAAAGVRLATANQATATTAAEATVATRALGAAQKAGLLTSLGVSAGMVAALAPLLPLIIGITAAAALIGGAFLIGAAGISNSLGSVDKSLGLTTKQLEYLEKKGVSTSATLGDVFLGTFDTISDAIYKAFGPQIDWLSEKFSAVGKFIQDNMVFAFRTILKYGVGAIAGIGAVVNNLPGLFKTAGAMAANAFLEGIEFLINKTKDGLNSITGVMNMFLGTKIEKLQATKFGRMAVDQTPVTNVNSAVSTAMAGVDSALDGNIRDRTKGRVNKALKDGYKEKPGKKGGGASGGASDDADKDVEASQKFIDSLKEETAEIGKNRIETKMMAIEREAAKAPTEALAEAIRKAGQEWKTANNAQAVKEFKDELKESIDQQAFETSLVGKSNSEREEAIALRELEIRVMRLQREGITMTAEEYQKEADAIAQAARERGGLRDFTEGAERSATKMRDMADAIRETTEGFGDLFGRAGQGFGDLINIMADYGAAYEELNANQKRLDEEYLAGKITQQEFDFEHARNKQQMAQNEINQYGDLIGAAKGFFKEGTTGYRVLESIEKAYYLFKFAMQVKAMFMDKASTVSSVANSGLRAAADGVAAVAKAIASLPFPLNFVAGAATAALLVSFGVKMFGGKGGGGGKTATQEATKAADNYNGPRDEYGNPTSSYSVLKPGSTTVANDNRAPMPSSSPGGNVSIGDVNLTVQGGADKNTVEQIKGLLEENRQQTLAEARELAARDFAASNSRQFIGG